jgi:predicted glutamine amidotransferase
MCGIFGAITNSKKLGRKPIDLGALRALAMANRERGKEALGFFDSTESIFKKADDPIDVLATGDCTEWLDRAESEAWFIVGHTRYGTRGANVDENSHPFKYGNVIGAHNGIIDAPNNYTVDSEYAIDMLDQAKSDYQKALEDDWGYWTLGWYDNRIGELFVSMYDNTCGIAKYKGVWYFSSDPDHLATAFGVRDTIVLKNGQTVSFDNKGRMKYRKKFTSSIGYSYKKDRRTSGGSSSYSSYSSASYSTSSTSTSRSTGWPEDKWDGSDSTAINDPDNFIRDYDEEFRELWERYAHEYDAV